eukprot:TRINITY_DN13808_c0_g1_i3.p3 TRINITY_DN13808_c0_g1~~TRINITY_DN13808_c0_g1_i3.p3  ORF type:complete len:140 (+),score=28.28 TRINITY_DN13808_c0_g1_i3:156-575(+)
MLSFDDRKKIGVGLTGFGFLFTFLGVLFLFDRGLLALGNLLFLVGVSLTIGLQATFKFFTRTRNRKGSAFFLGGAAFVLWGWTIIGLIIETYGFWLLFAAFFPTALQFFRKLPYVGKILDAPFLKSIINRIAPAQTLPV